MKQIDPAGVCPRDESALVPHEERGLKSLRCGKCAGLFVDRSALLGLLPSGESGVGLGGLPESTAACARCRVTMRMRVHRGTEIDICPQCHSVWLDAGEWESIARPASTRGSHFGRTAAIAGAAVLAGGAAGAAAASAKASAVQAAAATPGAESLVSQIAGGIGDVAIDGVVEVVFEFVGEALSSIF
jgi:Zn-finger nucleic acid-binding protein